MISPYKLKWGELSSLDLDLWTELSFDGDSGQTSTFLNRENITTEHYDGKRTIHRSKYQEVLAPTITLIKQNYDEFNSEENRRVLSWLTSNEKPGYLEIFHDDSEVVSYRLFGNWTEIEQYKLSNGRVIGYVATFESSAPYAWSRNLIYPEVHVTMVEISNNNSDNDWLKINGTESFSIDCKTDEYNKLLYPKVTIKFDDDEYIRVNNDPIAEEYSMLPNTIYIYNNRNYIRIPKENFKGEISAEFLTDPENTIASLEHLGNYFYFKNKNAIYKAIGVCEEAKEYITSMTYYTDDKGLNVANPQPTNETEFQAKTYYVLKDVTWEFTTKVGIGCRIENTSVKNYLGTNVITELVGNKLNEEIILDGTNKVISSSLTTQSTFGRTFGDEFNWVWPPLAYDKNNFTVTGNCSIRFEWIEPRKVGSL